MNPPGWRWGPRPGARTWKRPVRCPNLLRPRQLTRPGAGARGGPRLRPRSGRLVISHLHRRHVNADREPHALTGVWGSPAHPHFKGGVDRRTGRKTQAVCPLRRGHQVTGGAPGRAGGGDVHGVDGDREGVRVHVRHPQLHSMSWIEPADRAHIDSGRPGRLDCSAPHPLTLRRHQWARWSARVTRETGWLPVREARPAPAPRHGARTLAGHRQRVAVAACAYDDEGDGHSRYRHNGGNGQHAPSSSHVIALRTRPVRSGSGQLLRPVTPRVTVNDAPWQASGAAVLHRHREGLRSTGPAVGRHRVTQRDVRAGDHRRGARAVRGVDGHALQLGLGQRARRTGSGWSR